jgi:hypothetical protein
MFGMTLLVVSILALAQFALYYWRAILSGVAGHPVSDGILAAASVEDGCLTGQHFPRLASLHDLTPDLDPRRGGLGLVRVYYRAICALGTAVGPVSPWVAAWSENERALCARYAAVQVDRRLQTNLALSAALRSC